jgi:hypothetical protein
MSALRAEGTGVAPVAGDDSSRHAVAVARARAPTHTFSVPAFSRRVPGARSSA